MQEDPLRALSLYTDGRAIIHRNDLTMAMKDIARDSSGYYLLGYNSTFTGTDGKFHDVNVRVKRPGVEVRARKGVVTARLLDRSGRAMAELPVAASGLSRSIDVALANLAPGDYLVELDAASDGGEFQELVGFQVVG